jgi:transcriptional regulator with XRE-family HTH domain
MANGGTAQRLLREQVAEEVRALLARKMKTGADVAAAIGKSPMYVSRRVRGEVAFDLDDIQKIAEVLDVEIDDLFPRKEGRSNRDFEFAPAERAVTVGQASVALTTRVSRTPRRKPAPRPFSQPKPGPTRPVSAVPARKRRPQPVRPGVRRTAQ